MNSLIIGGTSGLGLELARTMADAGAHPIITGRHDPEVEFAEYREFDLSSGNLPERIGAFVVDLPEINALVYAPGYYQKGLITDFTDKEILEMHDVCQLGLTFFVKKLLEKQDKLDELVPITSTSQRTPRKLEAPYTGAKAGAGHYSHSQSLDERISQTLVIAPSGMDTAFWDQEPDVDRSKFLSPSWVAEQIQHLRKEGDSFMEALILREPARVEIVERTGARERSKHGNTDF